ncbi:MAG: RDD family protein [Puniceicoccaceae bacterium]|nr:MAG: RDD family protein [Puniceicoccaceae bacterium]
MSARFNTLVVQTPEGVEFIHRLASPVSRGIAVFIDLIVLSFLISIVTVPVTLLGWVSMDLAQALAILLTFLLSIGYSMVLELFWRGQTVGKRLLGLRVIDAHGLKLRPSQVILRNLLRAVDSLPVFYFVGGLAALLHPRYQRPGDLAAGTVVVRQTEHHPPALRDLEPIEHNSFQAHPREEALLRRRITPEQAEIALQALRRRGELEPAARLRLFARLADVFRSAAPFPEDTAAPLSDERYLRNCVDSIFRQARTGPENSRR